MEGNSCFQIDWASLIVGSKFIIFASMLYFALTAIFQVQTPRGLMLVGWFSVFFFVCFFLGITTFWRLIHGKAYFRNFMVTN